MRLKSEYKDKIKAIVQEVAGPDANVVLFGSRIDDSKRGGDVDLLIELPFKTDKPAALSALLASKISRVMSGRKTDIIISAPNLKKLPIHQHAKETGILL